MLRNVINGVRRGDTRELKSERSISGLISVVLSLRLDKSKNGSFVYPYKSGKRTLFNLIRKAKRCH
jgi:hypothetical protein